MTCCPDQPRIVGVTTRDGRPVSDLHLHHKMLRGIVAGDAKPVFWYVGGHLTPVAETPLDLVP